MPDFRRASCRNCGAHKSKVGPISWGGYCGDCARDLLVANIHGLHTKSGVPWQRWKIGVAENALGPEVTAALFKAGIFAPPLDEPIRGR